MAAADRGARGHDRDSPRLDGAPARGEARGPALTGGQVGVGTTNPGSKLEVHPVESDDFTVQISSQDGSAVVQVEFDWSVDTDRKYDEVVREVNTLRPSLPDGLALLEVRRRPDFRRHLRRYRRRRRCARRAPDRGGRSIAAAGGGAGEPAVNPVAARRSVAAAGWKRPAPGPTLGAELPESPVSKVLMYTTAVCPYCVAAKNCSRAAAPLRA